MGKKRTRTSEYKRALVFNLDKMNIMQKSTRDVLVVSHGSARVRGISADKI